MHWGYKTLPEARIYVLKNFTDMDMELSSIIAKTVVYHYGNTSLAPGRVQQERLCPQMGLPVGEHDLGVTVTAKTATGETITKKIWDSFRVDSRTFQGLVDTIEPVTGITNGVEKTADALHLPSVLKVHGAEVDGEKTTFSADVKWDVENCAYNPKNTASQSFTVNGQLNCVKVKTMKSWIRL